MIFLTHKLKFLYFKIIISFYAIRAINNSASSSFEVSMAQTQAFFDDIQEQIKYEINKATKSILIAVAWFTDKEIFNLLCNKSI